MTAEDVPLLRELYERRGLERKFPDTVAAARVFVVDGKPIAMVSAEVVAEMVLVVDPNFDTPGMRASVLRELYGEVSQRLIAQGVHRGVAWIHDRVKRHFPRRLRKELGWQDVKELAVFGDLEAGNE